MSHVDIQRAIESIPKGTTEYSPIVETIVNGIQAIEELGTSNGRISVTVIRETEANVDDNRTSEPDIAGFEVADNGIGFTDSHYEAFDTLFTRKRIGKGGKGFGRLTCLRYFENVSISSIYEQDSKQFSRSFQMGQDQELVINSAEPKQCETSCDTGSVVTLTGLKTRFSTHDLTEIAQTLFERLLPYFVADDYVCPTVVLAEEHNGKSITLNNYLQSIGTEFIEEVPLALGEFSLTDRGRSEGFKVRLFKFFPPRGQNAISFVAHNREVGRITNLGKIIPEFTDSFRDDARQQNYVVKAYTFGLYLDNHVSIERGGFEFPDENDLEPSFQRREIEEKVAEIVTQSMEKNILPRRKDREEQLQRYVNEVAPWHKTLVKGVDLNRLPYKLEPRDIEEHLHRRKYEQEVEIKGEVEQVLSDDSFENIRDRFVEVASKLHESCKDDLIHYVVRRRAVLDLLRRTIELKPSGDYEFESAVHDIVFPRKGDSDSLTYGDHNLWLLDERLNFTRYVASDRPLSKDNPTRPDLLVYHNPVIFRESNEESSPITVIEFKRPGRDDFFEGPRSEDPTFQISRCVADIRRGKATVKGRKIEGTANTLAFGYIVCDLLPKVEDFLDLHTSFKRMPDGQGWFDWIEGNRLYIEIVSLDKLLKDATMRNQIFFEKLGI